MASVEQTKSLPTSRIVCKEGETDWTIFCYNFHKVPLPPPCYISPTPFWWVIHFLDKHPKASPQTFIPSLLCSYKHMSSISLSHHSRFISSPFTWSHTDTLFCLVLLPAKPPSLQFASHIYCKSLYSAMKEWKYSGCWSGVAAFVNFFCTTTPFVQCLLNCGVPDSAGMI